MTRKVAFIVAWTVVQQQSFVNFVLHQCTPAEVNILHRVEILKVRKVV